MKKDPSGDGCNPAQARMVRAPSNTVTDGRYLGCITRDGDKELRDEGDVRMKSIDGCMT